MRLVGAVLVEVSERGSGSTLLPISVVGSTLRPSVGIKILAPTILLAPLAVGEDPQDYQLQRDF